MLGILSRTSTGDTPSEGLPKSASEDIIFSSNPKESIDGQQSRLPFIS
jgi:hypothetical protein